MVNSVPEISAHVAFVPLPDEQLQVSSTLDGLIDHHAGLIKDGPDTPFRDVDDIVDLNGGLKLGVHSGNLSA